MKYIFLISLIIIIRTNMVGQTLLNDSTIIYQNLNNIKENPYLDSIRNKSESAQIHWQECPEYYFVTTNTTIPLIEKVKSFNTNKNSTLDYIAYCEISLDWQGILRKIIVVKREGNINIDELKNFFQGMEAKPITRYGYGIDSKCTIKLRKTKELNSEEIIYVP